MTVKTGFVGLGVMGSAMAVNLASGFPGLMIYDVDKQKTQALISDRIQAADSLEALGRECSIVFLSLPTSAIVRDVVLGQGGLAESMSTGGVIVDTSTTEVSIVKELAERLQLLNIDFLDAPVSGGEKAAKEGTLSFMVGGSQPVFEALSGHFKAMGGSIVQVGGTGMGQTAKAVNQMIVGAAFAVTAESFALGVRSGLDPKVLYDAIKNGWAGSKVLDVAAADMLSGDFKPGGTVDIHWKDLGYALGLAKDTDVPVPVTALVHEIFKAARAAGDGRKSQPAVVKLWESLLHIEVK